MVDALDLGSSAARRVGSSPTQGTIYKHTVPDCDLVHPKSSETETVCFYMAKFRVTDTVRLTSRMYYVA